ncbi:MAG: AraC family transcriptional regulator [Alphaproteobacteria bacterium]|nr:AraC family transcriptional regulator [Alphaproteobacteria bacterium]
MTTDWIRRWPSVEGVERLAARLVARGYDRHRHDTYTICVTLAGMQCFDYRGATRRSGPGDVVVLHPDEVHDGRPGDADGFAYAAVYVAPSRIAEALRAVGARATPLPFARDAITRNPRLAASVREALGAGAEPLAMDAIVLGLAEGLAQEDATSARAVPSPRFDRRAVERARDWLDAAAPGTLSAARLEAVCGLSRFDLARQFRLAYGTSPHRYAIMRRLDVAQRRLLAGQSPAAAAAGAGFADQAHLTRQFRAAFGVTPGRFVALALAGRRMPEPVLPP